MPTTRKPCENCGRPMWAQRSDARTCSGRCRVALHRKEAAERAESEPGGGDDQSSPPGDPDG